MGGGKSLNFIRIPSFFEIKSILLDHDLNGCIIPGSDLVWNYNLIRMFAWTQNNTIVNANIVGVHIDGSKLFDINTLINKNDYDNPSWHWYGSFRPIIEYRE